MDFFNNKMVINLMDYGKMIQEMVMESKYTIMVINLWENGKMI